MNDCYARLARMSLLLTSGRHLVQFGQTTAARRRRLDKGREVKCSLSAPSSLHHDAQWASSISSSCPRSLGRRGELLSPSIALSFSHTRAGCLLHHYRPMQITDKADVRHTLASRLASTLTASSPTIDASSSSRAPSTTATELVKTPKLESSTSSTSLLSMALRAPMSLRKHTQRECRRPSHRPTSMLRTLED